MTRIHHTLLSLALLLACVHAKAQDTTAYINSADIIKQGSALHDQEKYEEALALYQMVSPSDSNYSMSLAEQMFTHTTQGAYVKSIAIGREALAMTSSNKAGFYSRLGSALDYNEEIEEALSVFEEGYAKYPYHQSLIYNYGVTLRRAGKYKEAQEMFIKRLQLAPYHSSSHLQLAELSMLQGLKAKSLMSYLVYLAIKPNDRETLSKVENFLAGEVKEENTLAPYSSNGYEDLDAIISAKVAIGETFKPGIKLDYRITRHAELLVKQLSQTPTTDDFWGEYYLPFYQGLTEKKQVAAFLYVIVSGVNNDSVQGWIKKNDKKVKEFLEVANSLLGDTKFYHKHNLLGKEEVYRFWYFDDGALNAIGNSDEEGKDIGPYIYLHSNGEESAKGVLDVSGNKIGDWVYHDNEGNLTQTEHYDEQGNLMGDNTYYYPSGNPRFIVPYTDNMASGMIKRYYDCGTLQETYLAVDNEAHGKGTIYYPSGATEVEYNMTNSQVDGPYKEYYESGKLATSYNYKEGLADGLYERFYENGQLKEKGMYSTNEFDGAWIGYFENGNKEYEMTYNNGKPSGTVTFYHKEGTKKDEYVIDDNAEISGDFKTYDTDGKLHYTYKYDSGLVVGYQYYDKTGDVLSEGDSRDSMHVTAYTSHGYKWFETTYINGLMTGMLTHYHNNGQLNYQVRVEASNWQGAYKEYYPTGELKTKTTYIDNVNTGWHYEYYKNGQISSEAMMIDGKMEQWLIAYYPDGTVSGRTYYSAGQKNGESYAYGPDGLKFTLQVLKNDIPLAIYQYNKEGEVLQLSETPQGNGEVGFLTSTGALRFKNIYVCGRIEGEAIFYLDNGLVDTKIQYQFGRQTGPIESFHANGQPWSKGTMKNDLLDSLWASYDLNGKLVGSWTERKGLTQGMNKQFYENGQLESACNYVDNERDGECKYYAYDGALQLVKIYRKGVGILGYQYPLKTGELSPLKKVDLDTDFTLTAYFANGNKSMEQGYYLGRYHGAQTYYFSNGKTQLEDSFKNGENHGWERSYYPTGQLKSEIHYEYDLENGIAKNFYKDGTLQRSTEYKHGVKQGEEIWYAQDGTVVKKLLFWNNVIY